MEKVTMAILRALLYVCVWALVTFSCAVIASLFPVINVREPWAGDGIGMMIYGMFGLLIGAVIGVFAASYLAHKLSLRRHSIRMQAQQAVPADRPNAGSG
jgi:Na+/H+ antiporter NhaA